MPWQCLLSAHGGAYEAIFSSDFQVWLDIALEVCLGNLLAACLGNALEAYIDSVLEGCLGSAVYRCIDSALAVSEKPILGLL